MADHDLTPSQRITCAHCGAVYEVVADGMIETRDDARCTVCRTNLTHWRQYVGLRLIDMGDGSTE